ncbi:DUF3846 domain-containing protein [Listeria seeligeri]|uniref:DUF3846 domain-containing protein n=1 Tax=Listeria seeligeri TaxID=1640 RepID=UPI001889B11C|nr:DUF3846 domain-containing protein [Listeria seeligeri]MBF2356013.1 DUF3846 domain-containing protein [Listeria seeligeri]
MLKFTDLPEHCYFIEPESGKVVIIQKGVKGFKPCKLENADVRVLNKGINVTHGVAHIMMCGSIKGFDYVEKNWEKMEGFAFIIDNVEKSKGKLLYLDDAGLIQAQDILYTKETDIKRKDLLNCRWATVVQLQENIDIWCDDEGLLQPKNHVICLKIDGINMPLAGNLLFLGHNNKGETIPLTDHQFDWLEKHVEYQKVPRWTRG